MLEGLNFESQTLRDNAMMPGIECSTHSFPDTIYKRYIIYERKPSRGCPIVLHTSSDSARLRVVHLSISFLQIQYEAVFAEGVIQFLPCFL